MSENKVKFGIQIEPQMGFTYQTIEKIALNAEKVGYDSIWSSDHFFLDKESEERNCRTQLRIFFKHLT